MNPTLREQHEQVRRSVHALMTAALRADPAAIAAIVEAPTRRIDAYSAGFLKDARRLVLAGGAGLMATLEAHRPGRDPYDREICLGCGGAGLCRTLQRIASTLAAYSVRPGAVDRAEAWRRADAWFSRDGGAVLVAVEPLDECFVTRAVPYRPSDDVPLLIIDRDTGALSEWPPLPSDALRHEYRIYRAERQRGGDS